MRLDVAMKWTAVSLVGAAVLVTGVCLLCRFGAERARGVEGAAREQAKLIADRGTKGLTCVVTNAAGAGSRQVPLAKPGGLPPVETVLTEAGFRVLLDNMDSNDPEMRRSARRSIMDLSNGEKIRWFRLFMGSEDPRDRARVMRATRMCFGGEALDRQTRTTYADVMKRRAEAGEKGGSGESDGVISVDLSGLPTKREAVQINDLVRRGIRDAVRDVRNEAMQAAMSFDVETCNMIYQYAMTACDDEVRLEVLRNAEYGDSDFRLRLQMAALDVGGAEVVNMAQEGIEKATGKRFTSSEEAFAWYEKNRTESDR